MTRWQTHFPPTSLPGTRKSASKVDRTTQARPTVGMRKLMQSLRRNTTQQLNLARVPGSFIRTFRRNGKHCWTCGKLHRSGMRHMCRLDRCWVLWENSLAALQFPIGTFRWARPVQWFDKAPQELVLISSRAPLGRFVYPFCPILGQGKDILM